MTDFRLLRRKLLAMTVKNYLAIHVNQTFGTGIFINISTPEENAKILREIEVK